MIGFFFDWYPLGILAGTAASFLLWPTRFASGTILTTLFVVLFGAEAACFDGQRHLTPKFDASFIVWGRAVQLRALSGLAILLVGIPCGAVVAKLAGLRMKRGALLGAVALCPFGFGLFASSVQLRLSLTNVLDAEPLEARFELLQTAIAHSTKWLGLGIAGSVLGCLTIALAFARKTH